MERLRATINTAMGTLSMYNGLLFGLLGIWSAALLFACIGVLSFNPLAMLVSLIVLVVSTGMSSWLIGALFGVRAHGPSSLITGVILALIFTPTLQPLGLLTLGLVGLIAGASKFILVYKGRHIFNPVAVATVAIGFTGLGAASWWVATPPLTAFVALVVAISLYKSKQYALVGTFLAVAIPTLLIYFVANGTDIGSGLILLLSWPVLFFAGIMLTEPLTLPPKKWHLYTEAVIVALLFALPIKIGVFETNPAVALLVGNVFAAIVANRHAIALTFKARRALTPTTDELVFTPSAPVSFEAGQYMELGLPLQKQDLRGERRAFSITSTANAAEVTFGIKFYERPSAFKTKLKSLKEGDVVQATNLSGDFVLPTDASQKVVLVAGGIGITPFISQLKTFAGERDIVVVYAVSAAQEIAYTPELKASRARVVIVCPEKPTSLPDEWVHIEARRLSSEHIATTIPDLEDRIGYVSGPPTFVQVTKRSLKDLGVRSVKTDSFVGY